MKYSYEVRLSAVLEVVERHRSLHEAGRLLGCDHKQVLYWVAMYNRYGPEGLKMRHVTYSVEFKLSVLDYMRQNHLSLFATAIHFGIPGTGTIPRWERIYREQGVEGLSPNKRGRRPIMKSSTPKKTKPKSTQKSQETLLAENERLRTEIAYLKKLQALVEERIKRESGKERKPSQD